jgi:hypothetical protein
MEHRYREALVTYVDVLGFGELVEASINPSFDVAEIGRIIEVLRDQLGTDERVKFEGEKPPKSNFRAYSFSDLTVRVTLIEPQKQFMNILNREIQILADRQLQLACWGSDDWEIFPLLLRGAISLGQISIDTNPNSPEIMFGPALVRSYKLESRTAVFPRIVIDRELMKRASAQQSFLYRQFIKRGDDGIDFINYLFRTDEFYVEAPIFKTDNGSLKDHKKMVEKKITLLKSRKNKNDRIIQKYMWLVNYHNSIVNELPDPEPVQHPVIAGYAEPELEVNKDELYISDDILDF